MLLRYNLLGVVSLYLPITFIMTQIDDVKSRVDIVELIGGYVNLQRSGNSYKANCPFHQERTPSFYVFPDRQSWRCFGACAEGGDALSYVMKAERMDFREALHQLAARVGVRIESRNDAGQATELYEINDAARRFYQQELISAEAQFVREYLEGRGISERSVQTFELGYSPPRDNRLLAHLTSAGYAPEKIAEAGLARETDDGRYYDLFRGRLIIPIREWSGRLAGFGSRALDDAAVAKYINTPRTPVFDKSRILYGMHIAKEPVRQRGVVIVEGYMDAIMAHQHGYDNVVASMGTAVTDQQVAQVRRLTNVVTMALDGDAAGQNATLRSLESSWGVFQQRDARATQRTDGSVLQPPGALELFIAELPLGQDPDDLIRESPEAWPDFLLGAAPLFDYLMQSLTARADMTGSDGRAWVARAMLRFVAQVPDPIRRDILLDELAEKIGVNTETLHAAMPAVARRTQSIARGRSMPDTADEATPQPSRGENSAEEYCLALLLQHWDQLGPDAAAALSSDWFTRAENREIHRNIIDKGSRIVTNPPAGESSVAPELESHLEILRGRELALSNNTQLDRAWRQIRLGIEKEHLSNEISQLLAVLQDDGDWESPVAAKVRAGNERVREIDLELSGAVRG